MMNAYNSQALMVCFVTRVACASGATPQYFVRIMMTLKGWRRNGFLKFGKGKSLLTHEHSIHLVYGAAPRTLALRAPKVLSTP